MYTSLPLSLVLLSVSCLVIASPSAPRGQNLPLKQRSPGTRTVEDWGKWAVAHRQKMAAKYGTTKPEKRSTGTTLITNQNADSSFFGSLAIGTPPTSYDVILDTGSSDLWVADANCIINCQGIATFDPNMSSTFQPLSSNFNISYGSGRASGRLGSDIVQMAGFSVSNQTFAICDNVSEGLLSNPVSGLLGLAFKTIAASGAVPFWQTLAASGTWDSPLMAFHLTRYLNDTTARALEYGGSLSMGFVNQSLYTGDIEYLDLATRESYWILPLTTLTTNGQSISIPSGSDSHAAIDTGTTLVGGPSRYLDEFYSQIPGARPGTGNFQGYYTYRKYHNLSIFPQKTKQAPIACDTTVNVTMSFGGRSWPISEADFRLSQLTQALCLGAFFQLNTGASAPAWIVGDTFLKNVYSVFRYEPPSVGFAELSNAALALNGANTPVPSATIGSVAATVVATGTLSTFANSGPIPLYLPPYQLILALVGVVTIIFSSGFYM